MLTKRKGKCGSRKKEKGKLERGRGRITKCKFMFRIAEASSKNCLRSFGIRGGKSFTNPILIPFSFIALLALDNPKKQIETIRKLNGFLL